MIPSRLPPSSGVGQPTIGRPFYGQAKGLLSPAGRFYGFPTGEARLSGFRRQRRHKKMAPERAPTSPAQRCFIPPEGGALNPPVRRSRSQAEPLAPRAVRPGGAINPRGKAASTFGNTGKHHPATSHHSHPKISSPKSSSGVLQFPSTGPSASFCRLFSPQAMPIFPS